jgi:protein-S-isoprenylcysteine O-methyltransferase Ste14
MPTWPGGHGADWRCSSWPCWSCYSSRRARSDTGKGGSILPCSVAPSPPTWYLQEHDPELLRRRLGARPGAEKEPRQKVLQAIAQLAFISLLIVPGLAYRFHRSPIPLPLALLGDLLVILGLWIVFLAFKANSYSSAIIEISPGQPVISTGPYRLVRHPMYAGTEEYLGKVRYRLVPHAW